MATPTAEVKRVRFSLDDNKHSSAEGQWDFLKYLLTLREEFNTSSVVDSLIQKGIISADAGTDIMKQSDARAQIELCVQEVMKGGSLAFTSLCEILQELGYSNIVDALQRQGNSSELMSELSDLESLNGKPKDIKLDVWCQSASVVQIGDNLAVTGKKMSLSGIAKEAKTSQKEFSIIVERQQELEKQLVQVMKSLDKAKDMLIKERQEKLNLREQLKGRDEELVDMQRKYLELQKAMGTLRETNNKYSEKVTKLQIENEQLRKTAKDKSNLQLELQEKTNELNRLKETFENQDHQMRFQEEQIVKKLSMIEKVVSEHKHLMDGQEKLQRRVSQQATELSRLSEERADAQNQMAAQQRQLNFQHAQMVMLQEHMQRMEMQMMGSSSLPAGIGLSDTHPVPPSTPATMDSRGSRYLASLTKGMNLRPFNAQGKLENSKNSFWRSDPSGKKHK